MKRIICLITVLCLIIGSFSFAFAADATWSTTDSQNLANVAGRLYYMNQSAAYYLYNIATNTNNIYNKCVDIYNALFNSDHNITYWVHNISAWMSPLYTAVTSIPTDLFVIQGLLGYPTSIEGGGTTWNSYLNNLNTALTNEALLGRFTPNANAHQQLALSNGYFPLQQIDAINFGRTWTTNIGWVLGSPIGNLAVLLKNLNDNYVASYGIRYTTDILGYNSSQNVINWGNLGTSTFTPISATDGLYKYLASIQAPVARLSYVLASDERIEAQEASAANEQAVVDNFIDSTGDGSASPSDIGSISDLSSGYKSNFGSDATVTGIFNIFNSNNMGWFSQETANQLDTTAPTRRGSSFDTPLLDQQINDIYDQIGVKHD